MKPEDGELVCYVCGFNEFKVMPKRSTKITVVRGVPTAVNFYLGIDTLLCDRCYTLIYNNIDDVDNWRIGEITKRLEVNEQGQLVDKKPLADIAKELTKMSNAELLRIAKQLGIEL